MEDPSWAELCHFAHFLSIQLDDCQNSAFCDPLFHDAGSGFRGFKTFVVRFMIQMAMVCICGQTLVRGWKSEQIIKVGYLCEI